MRLRSTVLFMTGLLLVSPVLAFPAPEGVAATLPKTQSQDVPFAAATVSEFLDSCDRDTSQCEFKLRLTLLDKLDARDATSVCIKDAHTRAPVIAWLKAHPQTHAWDPEDGIYAAYKALYPCP